MAEQWTKIGEDYEVTDNVIVRRVNKTRLLLNKQKIQDEIAKLQNEIAIIDTDIAKIEELEV